MPNLLNIACGFFAKLPAQFDLFFKLGLQDARVRVLPAAAKPALEINSALVAVDTAAVHAEPVGYLVADAGKQIFSFHTMNNLKTIFSLLPVAEEVALLFIHGADATHKFSVVTGKVNEVAPVAQGILEAVTAAKK